jgi:hypothetical protein
MHASTVMVKLYNNTEPYTLNRAGNIPLPIHEATLCAEASRKVLHNWG